MEAAVQRRPEEGAWELRADYRRECRRRAPGLRKEPLNALGCPRSRKMTVLGAREGAPCPFTPVLVFLQRASLDMFGFAGLVAPVAINQVCHCSVESARDERNRCGCVSIKLYL